jgi:hypothetical protein
VTAKTFAGCISSLRASRSAGQPPIHGFGEAGLFHDVVLRVHPQRHREGTSARLGDPVSNFAITPSTYRGVGDHMCRMQKVQWQDSFPFDSHPGVESAATRSKSSRSSPTQTPHKRTGLEIRPALSRAKTKDQALDQRSKNRSAAIEIRTAAPPGIGNYRPSRAWRGHQNDQGRPELAAAA